MIVKLTHTYTVELPDAGTPEHARFLDAYDREHGTINGLTMEDIEDGCAGPTVEQEVNIMLANWVAESPPGSERTELMKGFAESATIDGEPAGMAFDLTREGVRAALKGEEPE